MFQDHTIHSIKLDAMRVWTNLDQTPTYYCQFIGKVYVPAYLIQQTKHPLYRA